MDPHVTHEALTLTEWSQNSGRARMQQASVDRNMAEI